MYAEVCLKAKPFPKLPRRYIGGIDPIGNEPTDFEKAARALIDEIKPGFLDSFFSESTSVKDLDSQLVFMLNMGEITLSQYFKVILKKGKIKDHIDDEIEKVRKILDPHLGIITAKARRKGFTGYEMRKSIAESKNLIFLEGRRKGNTTRAIDAAIQMLFTTGRVQFADHAADPANRAQHTGFKKMVDRLAHEHGIKDGHGISVDLSRYTITLIAEHNGLDRKISSDNGK
jgi:hypothetical protein